MNRIEFLRQMTVRWKAATGIGIFLSILLVVIGIRYLNRGFDEVNPKFGPIVEAIYGLGTVKAEHRFEVKIAVPSTLERIDVQEGQSVKKDASLVRFVEGLVFKAPFDGTVTLVAFQPYETVFPQMPVIRLEDLNQLYIEVALEQQGALRVRPEQAAKISFETIRGEDFSGKVTSVFPREGEFLVQIKLDHYPQGILPGMTADVAIEVSKKEKVLLVPVAAVANGAVWIWERGHRKRVEVKLGTTDGQWAEVLSGDITPESELLVRKE